MYSMPQPNTYGQYGFGGYGGFPNQATAGSPGATAPGMPQPATAGASAGLGAGQAAPGPDPAAAAAAAAAAGQGPQAQWSGGDPNSYYSNYWSGKLSSIFMCVIL